jgi:hypothetical protein
MGMSQEVRTETQQNRARHAGNQCGKLIAGFLFTLALAAGFESALGTEHVTLAWERSTDPLVSGYNVYYGNESGLYTNMFSPGNETNTTIWGLEEGTTYYFATTMFDSNGVEGDFSAETSRYIEWSTDPAGAWLNGAKGSYSGLIYEPEASAASSGAVSVSIGSKSSYSGRLRAGTRSRSFTGHFDAAGSATNIIKLDGANSLVLRLRIGSGDERGMITGQLGEGSRAANLTANRHSFDARTNPAPCAGVYTIILPGAASEGRLPEGCSYGVVKVSAGGLISFAGALADGTKVAQAAGLSTNRYWPVYIPLYRGGGMLLSWLAFTPQTNSDIIGDLKWIKPPAVRGKYYPAGFTNECTAIASRYHTPASPQAPLLDPAQVSAEFSGGDLSSNFTTSLELGPFGRVKDLGAAGLSMRFSLNTGLFQGRVVDAATGERWNFGGAVILNMNMGFGMMLGRDKTSRVVISP